MSVSSSWQQENTSPSEHRLNPRSYLHNNLQLSSEFTPLNIIIVPNWQQVVMREIKTFSKTAKCHQAMSSKNDLNEWTRR